MQEYTKQQLTEKLEEILKQDPQEMLEYVQGKIGPQKH